MSGSVQELWWGPDYGLSANGRFADAVTMRRKIFHHHHNFNKTSSDTQIRQYINSSRIYRRPNWPTERIIYCKYKMTLSRRTASISRITNETKIQVSLSLDGGALLPYEASDHFDSESSDGVVPDKNAPHSTQFTSTQQVTINTGIGFLDHMLHALAKHSGWSLAVRAKGDLYSEPSLFIATARKY